MNGCLSRNRVMVRYIFDSRRGETKLALLRHSLSGHQSTWMREQINEFRKEQRHDRCQLQIGFLDALLQQRKHGQDLLFAVELLR